MRRITYLFASVVAMSFVGCSSCDKEPSQEPAEETEAVSPFQPLPETQELDERKIALGRRLYYDTALSGDGTLACASCHRMSHGGAEPTVTSVGIRGQMGPINAPSVLNSSFNFKQFWDGRAEDLAEQAAGPVENPLEMGTTWEETIARLEAIERYQSEFGAIYEDGITKENTTDAIAEFERSLITPSRFDQFLRGDESVFNAQERRGYQAFIDSGCTTCHQGVGVGGGMFQRMGLVQNYFERRGGELTEADLGRFNVTQEESHRHLFKVPVLRNVELTPPYFHDGSEPTLEGAVRTMGLVQLGMELEDNTVADIVAFLKTMTGEIPEHAHRPEDMPEIPVLEPAAEAAGDGDEAAPDEAAPPEAATATE